MKVWRPLLSQYRRKRLPFVSTNLNPPTVEEAVNNILYNAPQKTPTASHRHILNCLVSNEPGVLSRVSGILAARGFNIDSLVVAKTEVKDLSRMTVVINGQDGTIEQAIKQLEDIVPMWAVLDYTGKSVVQREILLVKVSTVPYELNEAGEEAQHKGGMTPLASFSMHRQSINELAKLFGAKVVDVGHDSMIIELCAKSSRVDAFVDLLKPFGILEAARSGTMAMPRSVMQLEEDKPSQERQEVDATLLPPG
ncbi:acetolactate synthase small subunit mitochondrial precursor [Gorgonomyces haynaldii]|nr:acetolactate synthase small subunit mitochondrial precursor [Gorgonomyces haynaldii]